MLAVLPKFESDETFRTALAVFSPMLPVKLLLPPKVKAEVPPTLNPEPDKVELMVAAAFIVMVGVPDKVSVPPLMM